MVSLCYMVKCACLYNFVTMQVFANQKCVTFNPLKHKCKHRELDAHRCIALGINLTVLQFFQ